MVGLRDATDSIIRTGSIELNSTTVAFLRAETTSGSFASQAALSSTVPFTWASGDIITCSGIYEAA